MISLDRMNILSKGTKARSHGRLMYFLTEVYKIVTVEDARKLGND